MTDQLLYDHAYEMLAATNVFSKPPEKLEYNVKYEEKCSLLDLIRSNKEIGSKRMSSDKRVGNRINNEKCFQAISGAMSKYAESYPAPASFKKRMRENFISWLEAIRAKYEFFEQPEIPLELYSEDGENDTVVNLLLSLQSRHGVTRKELADKLGISTRAVLKDLLKLDPGLKTTNLIKPEETLPFYIGGQPVRAIIEGEKPEGKRERRYKTINSIHPLILQENLFQTATLLQALQRNYDEHESTVSSYLAVDIWSQLSDYARERIEYVFAAGDPEFAEFLEMLKDEAPDERIPASLGAFRTEREIFNEDWSIPDALRYYMKADRICQKLELESENEGVIKYNNVRIRMKRWDEVKKSYSRHGRRVFVAVTEKGEEIPFEESDVIDIL